MGMGLPTSEDVEDFGEEDLHAVIVAIVVAVLQDGATGGIHYVPNVAPEGLHTAAGRRDRQGQEEEGSKSVHGGVGLVDVVSIRKSG